MRKQKGFSAVELLITLFIAAAFLGAAYQLYAVVINNGGEVRMRAKADNIAYQYLRNYSLQATSPCSGVVPTPPPSIPPASNLPNATISASITCPYGTNSNTSKIEVIINYGTPQKEVTHAVFVSP